MRPFRDRLAELLRRARVGNAGGDYLSLPEDTREDWRRSADRLLSEANSANIEIRDVAA